MGNSSSRRDGFEENRDAIFVVPNYLNFTSRQIAQLSEAGQHQGVPFLIGLDGVEEPDRQKTRLRMAENLVSIKKHSLKIANCGNIGGNENNMQKYNLIFNYDSLCRGICTIYFKTSDESTINEVRVSDWKHMWGPLELESGIGKKWDSSQVGLYLDANFLEAISVGNENQANAGELRSEDMKISQVKSTVSSDKHEKRFFDVVVVVGPLSKFVSPRSPLDPTCAQLAKHLRLEANSQFPLSQASHVASAKAPLNRINHLLPGVFESDKNSSKKSFGFNYGFGSSQSVVDKTVIPLRETNLSSSNAGNSRTVNELQRHHSLLEMSFFTLGPVRSIRCIEESRSNMELIDKPASRIDLASYSLRCELQRVQVSDYAFLVEELYGMSGQSVKPIKDDAVDMNSSIVKSIKVDNQNDDRETSARSFSYKKLDNEKLSSLGANDISQQQPTMNVEELSVPLTDEDAAECVICLTDARCVAMYPCRHTCLCSSCSEALPSQGNKCPICRRSVSMLLRVKPRDQQPQR